MANKDSLADDAHAAALSAALGAQYEVIRLLGRGGMGSVYLAREPFLDRDVAVKVLLREAVAGEARERFLREARTAARLSHPNIVPLYTFGQAGDLLYYLMGFVDGESLEARLKRLGRLTPDETRRIVSELADALGYAHQMGIVHRDVKPDNVLLDRHTGRAMLTDFGVAKHGTSQETLTQTGVVVGTPYYMSPEQASGQREIDGRSDIYSLGVMAYRMATGRLPFEGVGLQEVLMQHATRPPLPPVQLVPTLPLDINTVIVRALAKDPTQRWPNARAVRDALSVESEESMPDELRDIAEMGVRLGWVTLAVLEVAVLARIFGLLDEPGGAPMSVLVASAFAVPIIGGLGMIKAVRRYGWRPTLQAWFRQPSYWKGWWPRFGRRPGDLWDRLPSALRFVRAGNTGMLLFLIPFANFEIFVIRPSFLLAHFDLMRSGYAAAVEVGFFVAVFGMVAFGATRFRQLVKPFGLSQTDKRRLLEEPTYAPAFWSRPQIAALLTPAATSSVARAESSADDLIREIRVLARAEESSAQADLYKEAAEAAGVLSAAISRADDELGQLARDADPRERQRIKASLDALGSVEANERPAKQQMRELLERQMLLFRDLEERVEDVRAKRERLVEQLRTLALHLAHLRAQTAMDSATASEITGRIHLLCRGIEHRIEGVKEVRSITTLDE